MRIDPIGLEQVPEVVAFVKDLGLGSLHETDLESFVGRNDNWAAMTDAGRRIFVKQLGGEAEDARARLRRVAAFDALLAGCPGTELRGPAFLGADDVHQLVAFDLLEDSTSGAELAADDGFDELMCDQAGRMIGRLHETPPTPDLDAGPHPLPPMDRFTALPMGFLAEASAAQVELYGLLQSDRELAAALSELLDREAAATATPTHGDLRLDQFLAVGDELYLTDWEELRLADPARDVGAFVGEWLYRAVLSVPGRMGKDSNYDLRHEATHEEIVRQGVEEVSAVRPRSASFWDAYLAVRGLTAAEQQALAVRSAAFAGWHLIDRMIASAQGRSRLSALDRAAAGIGRGILLSPATFTGVLGLATTGPDAQGRQS